MAPCRSRSPVSVTSERSSSKPSGLAIVRRNTPGRRQARNTGYPPASMCREPRRGRFRGLLLASFWHGGVAEPPEENCRTAMPASEIQFSCVDWLQRKNDTLPIATALQQFRSRPGTPGIKGWRRLPATSASTVTAAIQFSMQDNGLPEDWRCSPGVPGRRTLERPRQPVAGTRIASMDGDTCRSHGSRSHAS